MKRSRKTENVIPRIRTGLFSKKEAGLLIVEGTRHLHSTLFGKRDACYLGTEASLRTQVHVHYPWERPTEANSLSLRSSAEKYPAIEQVVSALTSNKNRELREKVTATLEELISNSLYHAYKSREGVDKYDRRQPATLTHQEAILVRYLILPEGAYLSVEDRGGNLTFEIIAESLKRCYGNAQGQIDSKPGGAGLGLYMIFESASHLCFERVAGKKTKVSVWIPNQTHFDPDYFSFNYFEAEK